MCGISVYIGDKPGNIDKLKILGMYNTTRGTDSCGIALNNQIVKGVGNIANFTNFIESKILDTDKNHGNYNVLIHTRNASLKSTKEDPECAHPFEIKSKKGKTLLVGMHNGVITNENEIAKKYQVKEEKVDSKTILSILAKAKGDDKMFKVLEDYEGAAVLIWYYPEEPNTLYIWKGASKKWMTGADTMEDERPLYIYRVKDDKGKFTNQFYLSSIKESLYAIGGDGGFLESDVDKEPSIKSVESNCIIKIVPGEKFKVRPVKRNQESYSVETVCGYHVPNRAKTTIVKKEDLQNAKKNMMLKAFKDYPFKKINKNPILDSKGEVTIDNEPFLHDFKDKGNKIYFLRGRYWINGHIIGGTVRDNYVTKEVDMEGYDKTHKLCDTTEVDTYYFFQGLLLQGKEDAEKVLELCKIGTIWNTDNKSLNLLAISKHVWGFCQNFKDDTGYARDSSGVWANGTYYPMFDYDRKYIFDSGYFVRAEYTATTPTQKLKIIKAFDEKAVIKEEKKENKPVVLPLTFTKHSAEISEVGKMISDTEEDVIFNYCYDSLSSIKVALKELEKVKDTTKFSSLHKLFVSTSNAISARVRVAEGNKKKNEEENELSTEKGPLYS